MARKPRKRRMGRYIRGQVNETLALSTLAATTLISDIFDNTVSERTRISSIVAAYTMQEFTTGAGDGPIMVGVAHSDYTDAEIEAHLENVATWAEADKIGQEIADRLVRIVGVFGVPDSNSSNTRLNDGKLIKTKLNWILTQGQSLRLWAYNLGASALAGTSPLVTCVGHVNLFPQ